MFNLNISVRPVAVLDKPLHTKVTSIRWQSVSL